MFDLTGGEQIRGLAVAPDRGGGAGTAGDGSGDIVLVTRGGGAKRLAVEELAVGGSAPGPRGVLDLSDGDEVVAAFACPPEADIVLVSTDGSLLRTAAERLPRRRAAAGGTTGMKLRPGAAVLGAGALFGEAYVIVVTSTGATKATPAGDFPTAGRGGLGVRICSLRDGETLRDAYVGPLVDVFVLTGDRPGAPDGEPVPFPLPPTRRGLVARSGPRPILAAGQRRW